MARGEPAAAPHGTPVIPLRAVPGPFPSHFALVPQFLLPGPILPPCPAWLSLQSRSSAAVPPGSDSPVRFCVAPAAAACVQLEEEDALVAAGGHEDTAAGVDEHGRTLHLRRPRGAHCYLGRHVFCFEARFRCRLLLLLLSLVVLHAASAVPRAVRSFSSAARPLPMPAFDGDDSTLRAVLLACLELLKRATPRSRVC